MNSIDVRCSAIVFRDDTVLLVHRSRNGTDTWALPGGTPRPGESMAACARPGSTRRTVDLVFIATADGHGGNKPKPREPDLEARFVPLGPRALGRHAPQGQSVAPP